MTFDDLRRDIANQLGLAPEAIAETANLSDLGLDSMRLMALAMDWEARGLGVDFTTLMEQQTLAQWAVVLGVARG